jgi:ferredoxin-NADP reductase
MDNNTYNSKLIKKIQLTNTVFEFQFEKPAHFNFIPGQFVQVHIPNQDKSITRAYSIYTQPTDMYLGLCIHIIPSGKGSEYFFNLPEGDFIKFSQAKGHFISKNIQTNQIFIATGVGLAAIYPIIKQLLHTNLKQNIQLLFGVRNTTDIFWLDKLEDLKKNHNNFNFTITLSQNKDERCIYKTGRVTKHIEDFIEKSSHYFICGSPQMIKDIRKQLIESNISMEQIHFEIF